MSLGTASHVGSLELDGLRSDRCGVQTFALVADVRTRLLCRALNGG